ncbi:hypothetical protein PVAND_005115 [Polypedilum vanderplanki]|uniref:Uncharacterized protein n=1 Tax=Polypedilum vanderplanki TaxID=319348 RepID=A0A9J6BZE4_POLVA|nr:hypothetical protein PVAND_005115 [Polypedilum vanderplanki]
MSEVVFGHLDPSGQVYVKDISLNPNGFVSRFAAGDYFGYFHLHNKFDENIINIAFKTQWVSEDRYEF